MSRGILLFIIPLAMACVSQRERRQSAFQAESATATARHNSTWSVRQQGKWSLDMLTLEAWIGPTDPLPRFSDPDSGLSSPIGRLADPVDGNSGMPEGFTERPTLQRIRFAKLALRADSSAASDGRLTDSATANTLREEARHKEAIQQATRTGWFSGWGPTLLLVATLVILVLRKLFR